MTKRKKMIKLDEQLKSAADIRRRILALQNELGDTAPRYMKLLDDNSRLLLASLNIRKELKMGEPAVSGVEYTEQLQLPLWCSDHETTSSDRGASWEW